MIVQCLDFLASAEPQLAELMRAIDFDVAQTMVCSQLESQIKCQFYACCTELE